MRNTLDGMNSRLEEAEEQINDPEDRVMESNQAVHEREKNTQNKNREETAIPPSVITFIL